MAPGHDTLPTDPLIRDLIASHPNLTIIPPSDPGFPDISRCYNIKPGPNSLAVARPRSAEEVCALVKFCTAASLPFVIRVGGHDTCGRSQVVDALMIDLREICGVTVNEDDDDNDDDDDEPGGADHGGGGGQQQRTARVGGGILLSGLAAALGEHGLVTPVGVIGTVGYVGWATMGGYGPLTRLYGLGVDQIVGAKVVTAAGEVVVADRELLKGIRGAAGSLGVVVEVTIKVYPLRQVLAGCLVYATGDDHTSFVKTYLNNLRELYASGIPPALNPLFGSWAHPEHTSIVSMVIMWASDDHDEGRRWFSRLESLAREAPVERTVAPATVAEYFRNNDAQIPPCLYGRPNTVSVRGYSDTVVEIIARYTGQFPGRGNGFCVHRFDGPGCSPEGDEQSVWAPREKHLVLEVLSPTADERDVERCRAWSSALKREVVERVPGEVVGGGWLAMTPDEESDYEKMFGKNYEALLRLKRKWDPNDVFRNTVPRIPRPGRDTKLSM